MSNTSRFNTQKIAKQFPAVLVAGLKSDDLFQGSRRSPYTVVMSYPLGLWLRDENKSIFLEYFSVEFRQCSQTILGMGALSYWISSMYISGLEFSAR